MGATVFYALLIYATLSNARNAGNVHNESVVNGGSDNWRPISAASTCAQPFNYSAQFQDSMGQLQSGAMVGHFTWSGDYVQCLRLGTAKQEHTGNVHGKFCMAMVFKGKRIIVKTGLCFPSSCAIEEVHNKMSEFNAQCYEFVQPNSWCTSLSTVKSKLFLPAEDVTPYRLRIKRNECFTKTHSNLDSISIGISCVWVFIGFTVLVATICEVVASKFSSPSSREVEPQMNLFLKVLICFSAVKTMAAILNTKQERKPLDSIKGLRAISMVWIVMGHTLQAIGINKWWWEYNPDDFHIIFRTVLLGGTFAVETFFVIRLTPMYAAVLSLVAGPWIHLANASDSLEYEIRKDCRRTWWKHLTYTRTYSTEPAPCMTHAWYLANDMALFLLFPIIVYCLHRKSARTLTALGLTAVLCSLTHAAYVQFYYFGSEDDWFTHLFVWYAQPWGHLHVAIIGAISGYLFANNESEIKFDKKVVIGAWAMVFLVMSTNVFSGIPWLNKTKYATLLYQSVMTPAWAICICWIIVASATGTGGVVNDILCWKGFTPISRLSYGAYLIHQPLLSKTFFASTNAITIDHLHLIYFFITALIVSILASVILTVMIEGPTQNLLTIRKISPKKSWLT